MSGSSRSPFLKNGQIFFVDQLEGVITFRSVKLNRLSGTGESSSASVFGSLEWIYTSRLNSFLYTSSAEVKIGYIYLRRRTEQSNEKSSNVLVLIVLLSFVIDEL